MNCPACWQSFDRNHRHPKSLPCGHSVCLGCLQDPRFGTECPIDGKTFQGPVYELPDNLPLLGMLTHQPPRPVFWCRGCGREPEETCLQRGHKLATLGQLRPETVSPLMEKLQAEVAAAEELLPLLEDELLYVRSLLVQIKAAQQSLRETSEVGYVGLQQALNDATTLAGRCNMKEALTIARTLALTRTVIIKQETGVDAVSPNQPSEQGAFFLDRKMFCSLPFDPPSPSPPPSTPGLPVKAEATTAATAHDRLNSEEDLSSKSSVEDDASEVKACASSLLDVSSMGKSRVYSKKMKQVLTDSVFRKVTKLKGLNCNDRVPWRMWSVQLLQRLAPRLEELQARFMGDEHFKVLAVMPALRILATHRPRSTGLPGLLLPQVESLTADVDWDDGGGNSASVLRDILGRFPNLQTLIIPHRLGEKFVLQMHPYCKLRRLSLVLPSSLLRPARLTCIRPGSAIAASLEELVLVVGTKTTTFAALDSVPLVQCAQDLLCAGMQSLKRVVLCREDNVLHQGSLCAAQIKDVKAVGWPWDVLCSVCHRDEQFSVFSLCSPQLSTTY